LSWRVALLLLIAGLLTIGTFLQKPIAQPLSYHDFADGRTLLKIPNAVNVLSNVPFFFIGLWGLWVTLRRTFDERVQYAVLFAAVTLTCFGSAYYHLAPDNQRLVWDRLPITLGFMGLFSAIVSQRIHDRWGKYLLVPLLALGIVSVWYWQRTESAGAGDLRLYLLVQFLPLLLIPLILLLFPAKYEKESHIWLALLCYALAKVLEFFDPAVHGALNGFISGHSLKHLSAAFGIFWLARMVDQRTLIYYRRQAAGL
jgi:hypothetical protein